MPIEALRTENDTLTVTQKTSTITQSLSPEPTATVAVTASSKPTVNLAPESLQGAHLPIPVSAIKSQVATVPLPSKPIIALPSDPASFIPSTTATASLTLAGVPGNNSGQPPKSPKSKKNSKKAVSPTVTMATAPNATTAGPGGAGENTGRWTAEEHRLFLQGLEQHGKGWKKIASLIKSRTVVQIRTHAQKYFQKLAKARQNGEEGDVAMEGRGGATSVASGGVVTSGVQSSKRRRQMTGTKRKAISSVVSSAQRQGKNIAASQAAAGAINPKAPLPAVAPTLAPFIVPQSLVHQISSLSSSTNGTVPSITTAHGTISGPALEDSLFRFLTPAPVASVSDPMNVQVNDVARQAGANPITVPPENSALLGSFVGGEISPVGVADVPIYPSWTDTKDLPSWYAKGGDVDSLLDVADSLDWLVDTGDLHETYQPPQTAIGHGVPTITPRSEHDPDEHSLGHATSVPSLGTLQSGDSGIPPLPNLFEVSENEPLSKKQRLMSSSQLTEAEADVIDEHLNVFDTPMDEHAFVSALLENNGESSSSLPVLS